MAPRAHLQVQISFCVPTYQALCMCVEKFSYQIKRGWSIVDSSCYIIVHHICIPTIVRMSLNTK